jgi:hypothetical protein
MNFLSAPKKGKTVDGNAIKVGTAPLIDLSLDEASLRLRNVRSRLPSLFEKAMSLLPRFPRVALQLLFDETLSPVDVKRWMLRSVRKEAGARDLREGEKPTLEEELWAEIFIVNSIQILERLVELLADTSFEREVLKSIRSILESSPGK